MPAYIKKPSPIDIPNLASKLPRSIQKPAAILGSLGMDLFGGQEPDISQVAPTPLAAATVSGRGALKELLNIIKSYKKDPLEVLTGEVIGHRATSGKIIRAPEGFSFGGHGSLAMRRDPKIYADRLEQRKVYGQFNRNGLDTRRLLKDQALFPDMARQETAPAVAALEELQSYKPAAPVKEPAKPLPHRKYGHEHDRSDSLIRVPFNKLNQETITNIQKLVGQGTRVTEVEKIYPMLTNETIRKIVKMPWRW